MRRLDSWLADGRLLPVLDVVVAAWAIAWIAVGLIVANELQGLAELSDTVGRVGEAAESSGAALDSLGGLVPLIGDTLEVPAAEIQEAGRSAQESGEASRKSIDTLSLLLGLSIALIPSVPVLAAYLPGRLLRAREARAVEQARRRAGDDPLFAEFLARRAAHNLSYRRLAEVSREPWRDIEGGHYERLAAAELERLGLEPRPKRGRR